MCLGVKFAKIRVMDNKMWAGGQATPEAMQADMVGETGREGAQSPEDIGERYGLDGGEYAPSRYSAERAQELGRETIEAVPYAGDTPSPAPETVGNGVLEAEETGETLIGTDRQKIKDQDGVDPETEKKLKDGLEQYKNDPKELSDFVRRLIAEFLWGRYGRKIGDRNDVNKTEFTDQSGRNLFKGEEKKAA